MKTRHYSTGPRIRSDKPAAQDGQVILANLYPYLTDRHGNTYSLVSHWDRETESFQEAAETAFLNEVLLYINFEEVTLGAFLEALKPEMSEKAVYLKSEIRTLIPKCVFKLSLEK